MKVLIHAVNGSLFPDADPSSVVWTGPSREIVTAQAILYASLAISSLSAFLAMLGKQWVRRYIRNRGGSAEERSRDGQWRLDGLKKWHFHLFIDALPVMLQTALLLLGCALSKYLWTISHTFAGVILAFTVFGVTSHVFFTLAAIFSHDCPYQTPSTLLFRTATRHLAHSNPPSPAGRGLLRRCP